MANLIPIPVPSDYEDNADVPLVLDDMVQAIDDNESALNVELQAKEWKTNKVTSISSASTDTQYPSAKCVYDIVGNIGEVLDTIQGEVI